MWAARLICEALKRMDVVEAQTLRRTRLDQASALKRNQ
jgi:hypothetical protein